MDLIYLTIIICLMLVLVAQMKISHENMQKLVDKITAGDYRAYKAEERADKAQEVHIEQIKKEVPYIEVDDNYL